MASAEAFEVLLAKGAETRTIDGSGNTALIAAASTGDLEMVRLFVDKGLDVNAANNVGGDTALTAAAGGGSAALIGLLIRLGANVNVVASNFGTVRHGPLALGHLTPLMFAAPYGSPEVIRALIDAGAKVNAKDVRGMTPLMLAVSS